MEPTAATERFAQEVDGGKSMYLSVTRSADGKGGFMSLPVSEIIYLERRDDVFVVHTNSGTYYHIRDWGPMLRALSDMGKPLHEADRLVAIDLDKVTGFDDRWSKVQFNEKSCDVANRKYRELKKTFEKNKKSD